MFFSQHKDGKITNIAKVLLFCCVCLLRTRLVTCYYSSHHADQNLVSESKRSADDGCALSDEARKIKLTHLLGKIKKSYYENNRHMAPTNIDFNDKQVKQYYQPIMPSPSNLKKNADKAKSLLKLITNLNVDSKLLKPREERVLYQFQYFLESNFDNIYNNYYDGVYMLGPDYFCEQTICFVNNNLLAALRRISVKTLKDLELIIFWIKEHRKTFTQYQDNIKSGVKRGMVNPIEVCKASSKTFAKKFSRVYYKGAKGAFFMSFSRLLNSTKFYKDVSKEIFSQFERKHGESFVKSLNDVIENDFGKPLEDLIHYLRNDYIRTCVPSNVSSGLGGLPLDYQYKDGKKQTDLKTTKTLPSGENIDVASGYRKFMRYYTTSNTSTSEAMDLGYKLVSKYYDEVLKLGYAVTGRKSKVSLSKRIKKFFKRILKLGREITEIDDEEEMVKEFKSILKKQKQFYNTKKFPESESDDDAHDKCDNDIDAKKHCPVRWSVLQKWFDQNKIIMKKAKSAFKDLFYHNGPRKTVPDCLVELVAEYNPTNGVPSYLESDPQCTEPASYFLPFFKNDMGPRYEDYNTNFHEARPGHHLQIQGFLENFLDECGGITSWINEIVDYYPSFSEGWGLYAENPILLKDTNVLTDDDKLERYGVLKWQIWRALRLIVDVGMHEKNMSRDDALGLFSKYAWDDSDTTLKELTRYQGTPGQATSYTAGQQTIISLRDRAKVSLGEKFNIKDFHYHLLSQGQSPFYFVSKYIDSYIGCTKDKNNGKFCDIILSQNTKGQKRTAIENEKLANKIASLFRLFKKRKHA